MRSLMIIFVLTIICPYSKAEIRNGFVPELKRCQSALNFLDAELSDPQINEKRKKDFLRLKRQFTLQQGSALKLFQRTEEIIHDLWDISPGIMSQVDNLRDANGVITHVYVVVDFHLGSRDGIRGVTNLGFSKNDDNTYASRFGDHSVEVRVNGGPNAIVLLAHELGHVIYQVPNLKSYVKFYRGHYNNKPGAKGHHADDPSHHSVLQVMNRFYRDYSVRLSEEGVIAKVSQGISARFRQFLSKGGQTDLKTISDELSIQTDKTTEREVSGGIH